MIIILIIIIDSLWSSSSYMISNYNYRSGLGPVDIFCVRSRTIGSDEYGVCDTNRFPSRFCVLICSNPGDIESR